MPTPREHKTVPRILEYAEAIGWTIVSREESEQRRGFDPDVPPADHARNRSLFFDDLLDAKVRTHSTLIRGIVPRPRDSAISTPTFTATRNSSSTCATLGSSSTTTRTASATRS